MQATIYSAFSSLFHAGKKSEGMPSCRAVATLVLATYAEFFLSDDVDLPLPMLLYLFVSRVVDEVSFAS